MIDINKKSYGVRWWILILLLMATIICYIDRLTVSFLAPVIKEDLGINNMQYATITTWFLIVYSVFQLLAGRLYDKVGTKKAYTLSITIWSIAAMLHATTRGIAGLSVFRGLLGLGESGHWPGVTKSVAEWFPAKSRAFAMGIVNAGASIGSVIAPPLIVGLLLAFGWKATFIVTGALGFVWVIAWLIVYRSPERHRLVTPRERQLIGIDDEDSADAAATPAEAKTYNAKGLWKSRQFWAISTARFFGDPIWWLYLTWLPLYLSNERGFTMEKIGTWAWLPFVFAAIGGIAGGWFSGFLMRKGMSVDKARKIAIIVGTLFLPAGMMVINAQTETMMWIYICLTLFGFQFWVNNVQTLPSDVYEKRYVGTVAGMGQSGAGIGSVIFVLCTGWVVDHFSYTPILIAAGILGPLATISLMLIGGKFEKVKI